MRSRTGGDGRPWRGARPPHPHAGLGRRLGRGDDPRGAPCARGLDVIAITDHERIDAARGGARHRRGARPAARGHRGRGDQHPRRPPRRASGCASASGPGSRCERSIALVHEQGGLADRRPPAAARTRSAPASAAIRRLMDDADPIYPSGRARGLQPDDRAAALEPPRCRRSPRSSASRPWPGPTPMPRDKVGRRVTDRREARAAADLRAAIAARDTAWDGRPYTLARAARHVRARSSARTPWPSATRCVGLAAPRRQRARPRLPRWPARDRRASTPPPRPARGGRAAA